MVETGSPQFLVVAICHLLLLDYRLFTVDIERPSYIVFFVLSKSRLLKIIHIF